MFPEDVPRRVLEGVVGSCIEWELVGGVSCSIDAGPIRTDVNPVEWRPANGRPLAGAG
jgi:hypothetical protein